MNQEKRLNNDKDDDDDDENVLHIKSRPFFLNLHAYEMIQTFDCEKNFISQIDSRRQRNASSEKFSLEHLDVLSIIE